MNNLVLDSTYDQIWDGARYRAHDSIQNLVRRTTRLHVYGQIYDKVYSSVYGRVRSHICNQEWDEIYE